jgi:hypothetical protein
VQKSTAEIAKVTGASIIPNISNIAAEIAIASFIVDNPNFDAFWITTN